MNRRSPERSTSGWIHKFKHVIIVMQENRSFGSHFGSHPSAVGIPVGTR